MRKSKKVLALSSLFLVGALAFGGLTSCGPTEGTYVNFITENDSTMSLSLPTELVSYATDATYFSPYVINGVDENGNVDLLSSGGDTLMTSGQTAKLYAYYVPEGYTLSAKVVDSDGNDVEGLLSSDGTITAPEVTEKTDYVITLYAEAPTATIESEETDSSGNKILVKDVVKKDVKVSVIPPDQLATNGTYVYGTLDVRQRSEISSQLERYAIKNGLTGVSISDNGGYALYNERVHSPLLDADSYIAGYGFGTFMYGTLTAPLSGEATEEYQYYYHSQITPGNEPGNVNYLNSDLAAVNDLYSYMASSYYTTELNEDYTAYEYRTALARSMPIPLDMDEETGLATTWKIPVWVGGESTDEEAGVMANLSFRTGSSEFSGYDHRLITLEDYLTPFKLLATQSIGWFRGAEQAGEDTANRQIQGFDTYYNSSANATSLPSDEEFSAQVGVSLDHSDNSIVIKFNGGFTQEFAVYQIDGLWANPICEDFVEELGGGDVIKGAKLYGTNPSPRTPVDTSLSVGPYYLTTYEAKNLITFAKNDDWFLTEDSYGREIYQIEGYHIRVNSALESDALASVTAWENNYVESCSLIDQVWEKYANDPRRRSVLGDNQQKWTFNRMDKLLWDQFFGPGGIWYNTYNPNGEYTWTVKPIASNDNFFYGLNLGVDRLGFAESFHRNPSVDYQNPIAKVNPATNELYNDSPEHKAALESVYGDAFDDLSTTTSNAIGYMLDGIVEEIEAGHYRLGTGSNPTVVELGLGSINDVYYRDRVAVIEQDWATEFETAIRGYRDENGNNPFVDSLGLPRIIFDLSTTYVPSETAQAELITTGMWTGRFDIQYAFLIDGNAYDTINNVRILMSDKMGGFELNFATDTALPSGDIYWDGKYWSFNSLWSACNGGAVIGDNGIEVDEIIALDDAGTVVNETTDGSVSVTLPYEELVSGLDWEIVTDVTDPNYKPTYTVYDSELNSKSAPLTSIVVDEVNHTITFNAPAEALNDGDANTALGMPGMYYFEYTFYIRVGGTVYKQIAWGSQWAK